MIFPTEQLRALEGPVAIVAHDAGAANILATWLAHADRDDCIACLAGPAVSIFAINCPQLLQLPLTELISQSRTLISGTGWSSSLEHDARILARSTGCLNIAVIDHWTDYRQRFSRAGIEVLPDAIWVADADAARLASAAFPRLPVQQFVNAYLEGQVAEVRKTELPETERGRNVLYVLEPVRDDWGPVPRLGEFLALDFFVACMGALDLADDVNLRLRPHPSDPLGKYDDWIADHPELQIELDKSPMLHFSLAWAGTVAGCQTYAMYVALAAGRRVVSTIPPGMPSCKLPQSGILRLSHLG